ncbi:DUF4198 domain-containing protein [Alsobacter sp. SYSU M60028]|uniref:DUF4198 domain-containing protein n=1 Tax=Alsobacter ponti TaxID=2962936 RepID=A0ABT1L7K2_9HYPH|nr:DUF4198 domain-containing protein [Alsobacter ponti]MCP8936908.1 DUF4198 domain-containing protein [Alsobacter ponti]
MTGRGRFAFVVAALLAAGGPASAHFLLLYPGDAARMPGGAIELLIAFAHPFPGAPMMELEKPPGFYVVRQRGAEAKPEKIDLTRFLQRIDFMGTDEKSAAAYRAALPRQEFRSTGDYVFVVEPAPFYEATEDKYIQQFTKTVVNIGGVPGNWDQDVHLPAEIRPLAKPYANWTGGVFSGVVLSDGKPAPFAEIEVQYMNRDPDLAAARWQGEPKVKLPHPAFETVSLRSDAAGVFTIGLPKAGWWGIAALAVGPETTFQGKRLSQDAVLWVQARDMK